MLPIRQSDGRGPERSTRPSRGGPVKRHSLGESPNTRGHRGDCKGGVNRNPAPAGFFARSAPTLCDSILPVFQKVRYRIAVWRYMRSGRFGVGPNTAEAHEFRKAAEGRLQAILTNRLLREALIYDIDLASINLEEQYTNGVIFPKGRALLRDLI